MSDTKERELVDVSALIAGDVQFVQIHVWTEAKGLHMVKLRVVEEVTLVDGCCPICDTFMAMPLDVAGNDTTPPYCSGCGNKIKRP